MSIYSKTYNTFYKDNAACIFCYKSGRKNSKCSDAINIRHLISQEYDSRVSDDRIMDQISGTIAKIVNYCARYKHIELSCYVNVFKQVEYENANKETYHGVECEHYYFQRIAFSSIEQCIDFVFSVYCQVYPHNKISRNTLHNNVNVIYFINQYYSDEKAAEV